MDNISRHSRLAFSKNVCLALLLMVTHLAQADTGPRTLTVWVFNALHSPVTRSKIQGFFDHLSEATGYQYELKIDNKLSPLLQDCINGKPDIIFASRAITNQIKPECDYISIAKTEQKVYLFVRSDSDIHSPESIKRIAMIRGADSSVAAEKELSQTNEHYQAIIYPTIYEMIRNLDVDKIDSFALPKSITEIVPVLAKGWHPIHLFNEVAVIELIVSRRVNEQIIKTVQQKLIGSNPASVKDWQNRVGFGAFTAPD